MDESTQRILTNSGIARHALAKMTLEQKVGQVFMLGFEGTSLERASRALVEGLHLGGVTLFARNIDSAAQLGRLSAELQSVADPVPLFISIDQEGGLVVRVTEGATVFPGNMAIGATGDLALGRRVAEAAAVELRGMGVNMNLAPVLDVNTNPLNPVIGVRAFGSSAERVSDLGVATIEALQGGGVSAICKHFPGHGDTHVDSHRDLPVVRHSLERLHSVELVPFKAAIRAGVDGIMSAHVWLPSIEPRDGLPATLSRAVLTGLLRETLGYQGLILTDALDMQAIKNERTPAEAALMAFEAGADMLLIAGIESDDRGSAADAPGMLLAALHSGRIGEDRLDGSVFRILEAKARRGILTGPGALASGLLNCPEHGALALEVARNAVTLQRDMRGALPLNAAQRVMVVVPDTSGRLLEAIRQFAPSAGDALDDPDVIVLGAYDLARNVDQQSRARSLAATGKPIVGVSLRGPYDAACVPQIGTWLAVYGDRPVHLRAAAEALFGKLVSTGRVP